MEVSLNFDDTVKTAELKLGGDLRIQHAAELKKVLTDTLEKAETTLLDLEEAEGFDLSSIQLLYAFHLASVNSKKSFRLIGDCPEQFRVAVENAGFAWADWLCFGSSQEVA